jgi:hypothetical protein
MCGHPRARAERDGATAGSADGARAITKRLVALLYWSLPEAGSARFGSCAVGSQDSYMMMLSRSQLFTGMGWVGTFTRSIRECDTAAEPSPSPHRVTEISGVSPRSKYCHGHFE